MVSKFLREQKRYSQKELCSILECSEEEVVDFIRKLKEFGILKAVKKSDIQRDMSELLEEDIEIADVSPSENSCLYVFTFVGVIIIAGRVIKCYPKYLLHNDRPKKEICQIIKVLEKYNSKEQIVRIFNDSGGTTAFNLLAVLLFLIQDYYENGVYSNTEEIVEYNGSGEILWDKTINETFALLYKNRPFYTEIRTKKRLTNDYDYFTRLHRCILTKASRELRDADLLELFDITEVELSEESIEDFGDKDYILYRIERELNTQFNTRKQSVLKTLYAYVERGSNLGDVDCFSLFGTNSFNLVWEKVCADILDNMLDVRLGALPLPVLLKPGYNPQTKLIDLIECPLWTATGKIADDTLIPDLITITETEQGFEFIIFDAKYYNARLEPGEPPKAQPGIESVTKQYLYQLAYQNFIQDHEFVAVKNCFLLPTEMSQVIDKGEVSMKMLNNLGLQNIEVRLLPAKLAFDYYLSGKHMDVATLLL